MELGFFKIIYGENLEVLSRFPDEFVDLIYIDPPFNTGKKQKRDKISYEDSFDNFLDFIKPRLLESYRLLKPTGSFFIHLDYREVHYVKVLLDLIFTRESFMNEIIWAYDYGARQKTKWPTKHDNILWYAKDPKNYTFNYDQIDRIPYLAPGLVGPEKAALGKTLTDCWWGTIVHTNGKEKTGYPTQKPLSIINRIVKVHTNPGDLCMDFFAGSGTLGDSATNLGRNCILIDNNLDAIKIMERRLCKN
jgi:site-specific DNA-methyltransferase (adenine-specific)